jgi:hypothetical protein
MGNKFKKPTTARRAASFRAVLGALVISSGVALLVSAPAANATQNDDAKVVVCKYVSTPGGKLDHVVVPSASTLPDDFNGQFPFEWTDAQGQSTFGSIALRYAADGEQAKDVDPAECNAGAGDISYTEPTCESPTTVDFAVADVRHATIGYTGDKVPGGTITVTATATSPFKFADGTTTKTYPSHTFNAAVDPTQPPCTEVSGPKLATASVSFQDPTCANGNVAKYTTSGDNVTFSSPTAAPGATVTVTASADEGAAFADESMEKSFGPHTFGAVEANCDVVVSPPTDTTTPPTVVVSPPKAHTPKAATVTTPTVVHAGLASVSTQDLRGEQGLALMVAGMVMLVAAGGLGLRLRGVASRI